MSGAELIPTPDSLQVHWLVFEILLVVTFLLHILLMNVMLGGSILAAVHAWRGKQLPEEVHEIPITIALAVNFGIPPLLFVQVLFGNFLYSSSILMGVFWISVIPILIFAYYAAYLTVANRKRPISRIWMTVSAVLLLVIGFFFVNNMTYMLGFERWPEYFANPSGTLLNLAEPTLWPRYLHMVTGALAVTGMAWAVWAWYRQKRGGPDAAPRIKEGLRLFWVFTSIQAVLGLIWLITLPKEVVMLFMGKSMYATALLVLGLALAIGLIIMAIKGRLWATFWALILTLVVMILMRDVVRAGYLSSVFSRAELPMKFTISPLILFLVTFVAGLAVLAWMIKLALDPKQRVEAEGGRQ